MKYNVYAMPSVQSLLTHFRNATQKQQTNCHENASPVAPPAVARVPHAAADTNHYQPSPTVYSYYQALPINTYYIFDVLFCFICYAFEENSVRGSS